MKKEKIYINKINKKIDNNQNYCDVNETEKSVVSNNDSDLAVEEKLEKLFNTNGYVFNTDVKIITNNKNYDTKIAGRVGNNIITLDNDIINVKDIKNIVF